jgi:hypothetical protein
LDAERLSARRARRAEAQDGPSKVACGAFSGVERGDPFGGGQKAWFLPACLVLGGRLSYAAAVAPTSLSSFFSSPLRYISRAMSQPPTSSPFTYNWGYVGQFE